VEVAFPQVVRPTRLGQERFGILKAPWPCINPERDALPGETAFRIHRETRPTDEALALDGAEQPRTPKERTQTLGGDGTSPPPAQPLNRRASALSLLTMPPVGRRVKRCEARGRLRLHVFSWLGLLKLAICPAPLHCALGCNPMLPGLALLTMERLDVSVA
jgi:hypothetical protein